jgi:hypothetical protein
MKKALAGLLMSIASFSAVAQAPVFTLANGLYRQIKTTGGKPTITVDAEVLSALKTLYGTNIDSVVNALNNNPFLKNNIVFVKTNQAIGELQPLPVAVGGAMFGGISVTSVVNGIADLMIDRAKQELTLAFFNNLQTFAAKYPEFQTLFPKSSDALRTLLAESYPQMLPILRTAFVADLNQLSYNLEAVLEMPKYQALLSKLPELAMGVQTLKLYHELETGETPDKILSEVDNAATSLLGNAGIANVSANFRNLVTTVRFADRLSTSLQIIVGEGSWISSGDVQLLATDKQLAELYMGLLWQQLKNDHLSYYLDAQHPAVATKIETLMAAQAGNILFWQNKLSQFLSLTAKVEQAHNTVVGKSPGEKVTAAEYSTFIGASIDEIDYALTIVKSFDPRLQADDYLAAARKANSLYKDIYSQQYTQAVSDGFDIITSIQSLVKSGSLQSPAKAIDARVLQYSDTLLSFVSKVKPYAIFIANMAEAKSESDVEAALDNAVLPVGSSSIKKHTAANLSIQSYLGAYFSVANSTPNAIRSWSDKVGVFGPIGLSYTPGFFSWGKSGALSVFGSAFDLGAIIDYKLKQDPTVTTSTTAAGSSTATKQYSINIGQIFSPGISLVYGCFGNIPLSLGIGAQYGPGLSSINAAGVTNVINPSWRFNVFLGFDLPFFNLINKSRTD